MADNQFEEEDFQSKFNGNVIKRIFEFIIPHKRWFFLFLFCTLITSVMDSLQVYLNKILNAFWHFC